MSEVQLRIDGMTCASCVAQIEKSVKKIPGVESAQVNLATEMGIFRYKEPASPEHIIERITKSGYEAHASGQSKPSSKVEDLSSKINRFYVAIGFSLLVWVFHKFPIINDTQTNWLLQLFLSGIVWVWTGKKFQIAVLHFFRSGMSNMNTLIGFGTSAAFIYSAVITLLPTFSQELGLSQRVYFEAVGFIISFVYLGQYFEERAKVKTRFAMESLYSLAAKNASRLGRDGKIETIPIDQVQTGDTLRTLTGEKFAVDGVIIKGETVIDESMLSGESAPVSHGIGDKVFAGTINAGSPVDYKAQAVGSGTMLAQIRDYVERAQLAKPDIQRYADKISGYFTPAILIIAVLTLLGWGFWGSGDARWGLAVSNCIAVLVIACPCALGLATPTAVVVATGRASQRGLLLAGGDVLEKATTIEKIFFDKTGTLTIGQPEITESQFVDRDSENEILEAIAAIETFANHPLSLPFIALAKDRGLAIDEPDSIDIKKGQGIEAEYKGHSWLIGKKDLLIEHGVEIQSPLTPVQTGSWVFLAKDRCQVAGFTISDPLKSDAPSVIKQLRALGFQHFGLLTGDHEAIAKDIAGKVGISDYRANLMPIEKAQVIREASAKSHVAMLGDGINDGPALSEASLSIAMGTGTDLAVQVSDVVLLRGDLSKLVEFFKLSHAAMRTIKQNLFLSFMYNVSLVPVAAGILVPFGGPQLSPVFASIAMALSSISVVLNSLRIKNAI